MGRPATLKVDIIADAKGVGKGVDEADGKLGKLGGSAKKLGIALGAGLAVAGAAAIAFGASSVKAYVEAEQASARLDDALKRFPKTADVTRASFDQLNQSLATKTRFDDDATASGQAVLAQFRLTGSQIQQLTPLMQDYAAKTGKDIPEAAEALGKAMLGKGKALTEVGIKYKDAGSVAGNFEQVMGGLRSQVGGFAEVEGKTAAGQAAIMSNQFGEIKETVGGALMPILSHLATFLIGSLRSAFDFVSKAVDVLKIAFGEGTEVGEFDGKLRLVNDAAFFVRQGFDVLAAFVKAQVLPAFGQLRQLFVDQVLPALTKVAAFVVANVVPALVKLAGFVIAEVVPALSQVATFVAQNVVPVLIRLAGFVTGSVIPAFQTIVEHVMPPLRKAFQGVSETIDDHREQLSKLGKIFDAVGAIMRALAPVVGTILGGAFRVLGGIISGVLELISAIVSAVEGAMKAIDKLAGAASAVGGVVGKINPFGGPPLATGLPALVGGVDLAPRSRQLATAAFGDSGDSGGLGAQLSRGGLVVLDQRRIDNRLTVNGALDPDAVARQVAQILRDRSVRLGVA